MVNTDIAYRYLPKRSYHSPFVVGLPARDILVHEIAANPEWESLIQANIATTGAIYEKVAIAKKKAAATPTAEENE